jgi:hypothetical protein
MAEAACYGLTELMYSESEWALALKVCNGDEEFGLAECPVREECLEYALRNKEEHGIWGGASERQRRKMRKRQYRERRSA